MRSGHPHPWLSLILVGALAGGTRADAQDGDGGGAEPPAATATARTAIGGGPAAAILPAVASRVVHPGADGRLVYEPGAEGDVLLDFSTCGYHGGGVRLPNVPVRATLAPVPGEVDALPRIQAAIDGLAKLPVDQAGVRGALLLRRGRYPLVGTLRIAASGVVLRGAGMGEDGTVLVATKRAQHDVVVVSGDGRPGAIGSARPITDPHVPAGARSFSVADASGFTVGERVLVVRPSTAAWLAELGMDRLTETYHDAKLHNWTPGGYDIAQRRTITALAGGVITLDTPLVQALDARFGGGTISAFRADGQIEEAGVEDLRIESVYDTAKTAKPVAGLDPIHAIRLYDDEEHAWVGVVLDNVRNGWVARVTTVHTGYGCAHTHGNAEHTTIVDCVMIDPVSADRGGRKYSFVSGGQMGLFLRCHSRNSRHDFAFGSRAVGPTAFVACDAEDAGGTTEPHHRYATGGLFDNVTLRGDGFFLAVNRGNSGSGHGWAGAQMVFWNCCAQSTFVMKPPGAQNYSIGWNGPAAATQLGVTDAYAGQLGWIATRSTVRFAYQGVPVMGDGYIEAPDRPVTPHSLYFAQLADRLGPEAVAAVIQPTSTAP